MTTLAVPALAVFLLGPQVTVQIPQQPGDPSRPVGAYYGESTFVPLSTLASMGEIHRELHVRTRGWLDVLELNQYYELREGNARVLVLVVPQLITELDRSVGRDVELRGIVRRIRAKEYVGPDKVDRDLIEHPDLPVLPAPGNPRFPPVSLTVLALMEADDRGRAGPGQGGGAAEAMLAAPPPRGKRARLVVTGQFRGRNLFGDLPPASHRRPEDWVLKDGDTALWVTGRPPRGDGFSLDVDYRADSAHWLEVSGNAEVVDGVIYLHASRIQLARPPRPPE